MLSEGVIVVPEGNRCSVNRPEFAERKLRLRRSLSDCPRALVMNMISIDWNPMPYLGPVPINWYGITFALAVFTSRSLVVRWAPKYGVSKDSIDRLLLWILVGVVAGARLYYVVQNDFLSYLTHPWRILAIWEGGLAFFGGLIGGILAAYMYCRREGLDFARVGDLFTPAIPIAGADRTHQLWSRRHGLWDADKVALGSALSESQLVCTVGWRPSAPRPILRIGRRPGYCSHTAAVAGEDAARFAPAALPGRLQCASVFRVLPPGKCGVCWTWIEKRAMDIPGDPSRLGRHDAVEARFPRTESLLMRTGCRSPTFPRMDPPPMNSSEAKNS